MPRTRQPQPGQPALRPPHGLRRACACSSALPQQVRGGLPAEPGARARSRRATSTAALTSGVASDGRPAGRQVRARAGRPAPATRDRLSAAPSAPSTAPATTPTSGDQQLLADGGAAGRSGRARRPRAGRPGRTPGSARTSPRRPRARRRPAAARPRRSSRSGAGPARCPAGPGRPRRSAERGHADDLDAVVAQRADQGRLPVGSSWSASQTWLRTVSASSPDRSAGVARVDAAAPGEATPGSRSTRADRVVALSPPVTAGPLTSWSDGSERVEDSSPSRTGTTRRPVVAATGQGDRAVQPLNQVDRAAEAALARRAAPDRPA